MCHLGSNSQLKIELDTFTNLLRPRVIWIKTHLGVIDPVISRNAFFATPENILIAMLTDDRAYIRTIAVRRIIKAREVEALGAADDN
jgi:hypothetical protein